MLAYILQKFTRVKEFYYLLFFSNIYMYMYVSGEVEEINTGFQDSVQSPSLIALAFYDGLWAYDGW